MTIKIFPFLIALSFFSCESEQARLDRLAEMEKEKLAQEKALMREKYGSRFLENGSTPYAHCYGKNSPCSGWGCSQIVVHSPSDYDVVVSIKKEGRVLKHAYILKGSSYTFEMPNGTYQPFFYYGRGWNPDKVLKENECGGIKGGFVSHVRFGKDHPQKLENAILTYELVPSYNGNFITQESSLKEQF